LGWVVLGWADARLGSAGWATLCCDFLWFYIVVCVCFLLVLCDFLLRSIAQHVFFVCFFLVLCGFMLRSIAQHAAQHCAAFLQHVLFQKQVLFQWF